VLDQLEQRRIVRSRWDDDGVRAVAVCDPGST
jgi:hypothetical protein